MEIPSFRLKSEIFWVNHQPFLLSRGYKLRPRFHPDWIPSWGTQETTGKEEDALTLMRYEAVDATRIHDDTKVVLKRVKTSEEELPIALYLSSDTLLSDQKNHTVPILDTMLAPADDSYAFIVMPMLQRFDCLPFRRFGEFSEALHQFLQGLEFMHKHNIAHRDACLLNLMMDTSKVIPKGFHFAKPFTHDGITWKFEWRDRWSVRPIQYYFIDFGLSYQYPCGHTNIRDIGILGQDKTVPELSLTVPYDPFKLDIYQLGNVIIGVVNKYKGLEPFLKFGEIMTRERPEERPSASEVLEQFEHFLSTLRKSDLRRRVWTQFLFSSRERFRIKYLGSNPIY